MTNTLLVTFIVIVGNIKYQLLSGYLVTLCIYLLSS